MKTKPPGNLTRLQSNRATMICDGGWMPFFVGSVEGSPGDQQTNGKEGAMPDRSKIDLREIRITIQRKGKSPS
jgi:hypothetical protein